MDHLFEKFRRKLAATQVQYVRSLLHEINWNARLIGLKGARGVGKTTLLLQYIKIHLSDNLPSVLYISLDDIWFGANRLVDLADKFVKTGGTHLFIDEVHKYSNWSVELKNIYDDYPELKIIFTGSSLLEILNARADLSRRAIVYTMQGLSFREYLMLETGKEFSKIDLNDLLNHHPDISNQVVSSVKPLKYFPAYLKTGYYPFYKEQPELYHLRCEEVINMIIEVELPLLRNVDISFIQKIKQLLFIISEAAPFSPNISKLSERIGLNRQTMLAYLHYMNEAHLFFSVFKDAKGISLLQKPDKIFLENTNLMFTFGNAPKDPGNLRETFFANQLRYKYLIEIPDQGDFKVDNKYIFEIGGKSKGKKQIENQANAYIAADEIEYGSGNKLPLWMFGFLY